LGGSFVVFDAVKTIRWAGIYGTWETKMKNLQSVAARLLPAILLLALPLCAQSGAGGIEGSWDAVVVVGQAEIPFPFEISAQGGEPRGFFFEGENRIGSTSGKFGDGKLQLDYEFLNATLVATFDGEKLDGSYRYNRKNGKEYPFHARRAAPVTADNAGSPQIAGNWEMTLVGADNSTTKDPRLMLSWKLYLRQAGWDVSGSILRVDGDTGTLRGRWQGDSLVLSHFAGERPVLLEAKLQPDGTLDILLNKQNRYLAARTGDARAKGIPEPPDPARYTNVKDEQEPFHFRFPDVDGKIVSDADAQFRNKVVILTIGGTWCPNCRDEAPFLVELYRRYHAQGLEIVGLNFEASGEFAEDKPRIASFVKEFSVPYPVLYGGAIPDVKEKLPQIVNFGAYPTTIYLRRDGRVASVHAGFASAATGEAHVALENEVEQLVGRLLTEKTKEVASR
jgi:thiol-disulfide isomerase/thioredoxin